MNEACSSQRHESAYPRSEMFERRRRRREDRAAVSFPIHAKFYSFQLHSSPRQERQQTLIYTTPINNPQNRRFRQAFPIRNSKRRAC